MTPSSDFKNVSDLFYVRSGSRAVVVNENIRLDARPIDEQRAMSRHYHLVLSRDIRNHRFQLMNRARVQVRLWLFDCQN